MLRRIISKEEVDKKRKRNITIISVFLAFVMLFSTAGYFVSDMFGNKNGGGNSGTLDYNGITFTKTEYATWKFNYGGNNYETAFNPEEAKNASLTILSFDKKISEYSGKVLYLSSIPFEDMPQEGVNEILKNMQKIIQRNNFACLSENCSLTYNYPIKNCSSDEVIIFEKSKSGSNSSSLRQDKNCVYIVYPEIYGGAEKTADSFLFRILGIN